MNMKRIVTAALLAFVAASVVFMVAQRSGRTEADPAAEAVPAASETDTPYYAVYYFHGQKRCHTCLTIERYAHDTVAEAFAEDVASGRVRWGVFNYELPENEHFAKDYDISFQTLMVFEMDGDKPVRWKKLENIWDEVGSEFSFFEYVQSEVTAFMNQG